MILKVWLIINAVLVYFLAGAYLLRKTLYSKWDIESADLDFIASTCIFWPLLMALWMVKWICELGIYLAEKGWKDK